MSPDDQDRYSRQVLFPGVGLDGQQRLLNATVAVVGCGALGCFSAGAMARAGVGTLRLIDRDYVELSNLQRQWLFTESDAAASLPKAIAAQRAISGINSAVKCDAHVDDLHPGNIHELLDGVDLILDGTDNFETRYLLNDYSISAAVPWIYGAAVGSYGLAMPILPSRSACLRCVYPHPPAGAQPTCDTAGVLNTITSLVASLQVSCALRILVGDEVRPQITTADVWTGAFRAIDAPSRDPACPCCARREFTALAGLHRAPVSLCGRNAVQIHELARPLDLEALRRRLEPLGSVRANEFGLRFSTRQYDLTFFADGRAIIKGTTDPGVARSLYHRYIGA